MEPTSLCFMTDPSRRPLVVFTVKHKRLSTDVEVSVGFITSFFSLHFIHKSDYNESIRRKIYFYFFLGRVFVAREAVDQYYFPSCLCTHRIHLDASANQNESRHGSMYDAVTLHFEKKKLLPWNLLTLMYYDFKNLQK